MLEYKKIPVGANDRRLNYKSGLVAIRFESCRFFFFCAQTMHCHDQQQTYFSFLLSSSSFFSPFYGMCFVSPSFLSSYVSCTQDSGRGLGPRIHGRPRYRCFSSTFTTTICFSSFVLHTHTHFDSFSEFFLLLFLLRTVT